MAPYLERTMARIPVAAQAGIKKFFCGPESFTPDLLPIVGEAPELKNYFVAAGLNSIGILTGGGIGRVIAHWITEGRPDIDVTAINIDRLHRYQANPEYRATRTVESLGMVFQTHYPGRAAKTARGAKVSPVHDRLVAQRAYFRDVSGWEGADWYAPEGAEPEPGPLSWGRQDWFGYWEAEHHAARTGVILMDMAFMAKFDVQGRDAGRLLERISANAVNGEPGRITYTQWLNPRRHAGGRPHGDQARRRPVLGGRLRHRAPARGNLDAPPYRRRARLRHRRDVGLRADQRPGPAVAGAAAVGHHRRICPTRRSRSARPREIDIGFARVLCIRITYLGELGYELYIPAEQAAHVYDRLAQAGEAVGLRHAGLKALASLRMEKGYRDYGHDIDNTDTVLEAGLGFAVALDKPGGFIGRDAVLAEKARGPLRRRLVQILVTDPEPLMFHAEVVRRNGEPAGYIRSASYGFTLGGAVAWR